jgi:hypothetical protein
MKFLVPIDLVQNELQNAVIQNLTTNPTNAKAGQIYFNTTENTLYQYKGATDGWQPVGTVYELPIASTTTLGGIKVGYGLAIDNDGVLKVTGGGTADAVEWENVLNTPTTLNGYGIVDAKIDNGTITLNTDTITPITSINNKTGSSITLTASDVNALPSNTTYVSTVDGSSGAITTNAVKYTTQSLTDAQKVQARTNIGAGTSSFSGSYTDLTNKPTIDTALSDTSTNAVTNKAIKAALDTKYDSTNQPPYPVTSVAGKTGAITLDKSNVGLDNVDNVKQYSADNPPPYPVTSVNGNTGDITLNDVKYVAQTLTDTQKAQARTNIGAGTSSFSGSYKDLTDTPTIDTAMSATSTNAVQNKIIKAYVDNIIAVSQGIVYKGVINSTADIPTTYEVGWLYMIATAGTYVGQTCEVGDLMIAVVARKGSDNQNSDWDIIQTNIDGAITSVTGSDPIDVSGTSSSKTISLKTSGVTAGAYGEIGDKTPSFGGTFKVPSFTVDTYGRLTVAGSHTVTIPSTVASGTTNGLMVSADYTLLHGLDTRVGALETKVSTLEGHVITYGTTKIASTQTSVSVDIPSGKSITSVVCRSGSNNESIIADWKHDTTANTLTVSIALAVTYDINVIYTYM